MVAGAYEPQTIARGSLRQTSSCASSGKIATSHWWMAPSEQPHDDEVQPRANSLTTSMNAVNPYS